MKDLNLSSKIIIFIGFLISLIHFIPLYRKYKWLFVLGIILIGLGSCLLVISKRYELYDKLDKDEYQKLASGTVWTDSNNDNAGLGWVL